MGASKLFNKAKKAVQFSLKFFHKIVDKNFYRSIKYTSYYKKTKIDDRVIFYESFQGKSMIDSPYAIFKRLINDTNYKDYKHVWALNSRDNLYAQIYKGHKNVEFVKVHSDKYLKYLTAAKYLINNDAFPSYFQKKENQVYINTWHGTLSEAISKDLKEERGQLRNIQRNFLHTDYILNPNKRIANRLVESYGLEGIYAGNVVVEGYPRTDLTLSSNKEEIKEILTKSLNVDFNQKIILYAPTWKEETNNVEDISDKINELHSNIPIEYQLILKVHASLYERLKVNDSLREICIPEWIDTNELLSVVDILICDYSGIFYDFLITNRPIIFYLDNHEVCHSPDESSQDLKELPGPICTEINEVINEIADVKYYMDFYKNRREKMISAFCPYDDGNVTDRNIDIIFKSKHTKNVYPIKNDKKTILMYCGGFLNNGITTSAINLLNNLDYTKFNVVIVEKEKYDPVSTQNLKNLNHHVKKIYRIGSMNLTIREWLLHNFIVRKGLRNEKLHKHIPKQSYRRELLRLFGNVKFDIAIDFSGYVPFWSMLFAFSEFERKNIYQHNDMLSEYNKIINNKYKHRSNMNIIFPLYKYFDKVVSVAKNTRDLNVKNLPKFLPREKAVYVHNCIDANKILRQKNEEEIIINEQRDVASMNDLNDQEKLYKNRIIAPDENNINFVNMGRLSPEKDQKKLILAFSQLAKQHENIRLFIIGEGVLESELKKLSISLGLYDKVIFTGQLSNPFYFINKCDCFVLSSNHEGQPMVLLEAMILNKPIIATDIAGSRSVLRNGYGELVDNSVEGLIEGMDKFLKNKLPRKTFNYELYNIEALNMFYREVCDYNIQNMDNVNKGV